MAELTEGQRSRLLDRLRLEARNLRAAAEGHELLARVQRLERLAFVAAGVCAAAAYLVEDGPVSQAEISESKALIREPLERVA